MVHILLVDHKSGELVLESSDPTTNGKRMKLDTGIAGEVAKTGKTMIDNGISNMQSVDPIFDAEFSQEEKKMLTKQYIVMAIPNNQNKVMGVIRAVNKTSGSEFTIDDERMLQYICANAGITLTKA